MGCGVQMSNETYKDSSDKIKSEQKKSASVQDNTTETNLNQMHSFSGYSTLFYSPLIHTTYTSFLGASLSFSLASISYSHHYNYDPVYPFHDSKTITLGAGWLGTDRFLDSIEIYRGSLAIAVQSEDPPVYESFDHEFALTDVEIIFDYLEDNQEYFFDGSEFEGLEIPYESSVVFQ